ncbi:MAG: S49 family peptidase [Kurthia sp.]|nr:S49 family peptidase [Candidatus Kurthia equi]
MKVLFELQNGLWAFDLHSAKYYSTLATKFLSGQFDAKSFGEKQEAISYLANEHGEELRDHNTKQNSTYAVVELIGPVTLYDTCTSYGAETIAKRLHKYNNDDSVKGIILKTNTPGGAVAAINPFIDFAAKKKKPVIALCDQALSLGQWATDVIADHKMASNQISARFGSIGVVATFQSYKKALEMQGIEEHEIYADISDHKNKPFLEAIEGDYKLFKDEYLNPLAIQFQNAVKEKRPNLDLSVEGILNGRTFNAGDALQYGLIDSIGTMEDAIDMINVLHETKYNN